MWLVAAKVTARMGVARLNAAAPTTNLLQRSCQSSIHKAIKHETLVGGQVQASCQSTMGKHA